MANALITGVDGFLGRYMAAELGRAGYSVTGLTRYPSGAPIPYVSACYSADICDAGSVGDVVIAAMPEVVIHLAAISFVAHEDAEEIYQVNILGSRNLLEALSRSPRAVTSVLLVSSANVYSNGNDDVMTEETTLAPANDYAVSKLAMEYVAKLYNNRLPITIARPFNYTGIGQSENFLLPKIVSHFRRRAPQIELGNLDVARDFSDVRVVADCYRRLLECPAAIGRTFNVCSGRALSLAQVMDTMRSLSGHEMEIRVNPAFVRQNEVRVLRGSRARLEATIGKVNDIPIEQTLKWMLEATA